MRRLAAGLLCLLILLSCAAVYAAGGGESLVTRSYLEETYVPGLLEQAGARLEEGTQPAYQAELDARHTAALGGGAGASALTDLRFRAGDTLTLPAGSGVLLLAGGASASGALVDATAGQPVSGALALRHRCLAGEGGGAVVTVTSDTAVLSVEGPYTLTPGSGLDYNALADALKAMGLFQGSGTAYGSGYDLEQAPTRIVGLVMFLRLIGEEGAALASTAVNPFADTPAWCDRYVAYAFEKGYTNGVGENAAGRLLFAPDRPITADEYLTLILRALDYSDGGAAPEFSWDTALERSVDFGVLSSGERSMLEGGSFLRAQIVYVSYFSLNAPAKGGGVLLDRTLSGGTLTAEQAQAVMERVDVPRM